MRTCSAPGYVDILGSRIAVLYMWVVCLQEKDSFTEAMYRLVIPEAIRVHSAFDTFSVERQDLFVNWNDSENFFTPGMLLLSLVLTLL